MNKLVALCKRRGFIYPGSEIYGGLNGTWDLGPLGSDLARNVKHEWWKSMVINREDVVGLDSSILLNRRVWEASGHAESFVDPLVECKVCHQRFRPDMVEENSDHKHDLTPAKMFNTMFVTYIGPVEGEGAEIFLRPETAQGIFINFKNVLSSARITVPFGIAQIGKGFRNEITTGNFLFRAREFEMMEMEFFVEPGSDKKWHDYWKEERMRWFANLGIKKQNIKLIDLPKEDIAHYSKGTAEIWYNWPFMGWGELEGIANRGDYDLTQHSKHSGQDLVYVHPDGKRYVPYVIEPAVGVGRVMLAFLLDAYHEDGERVILKLHPKLAPHKAAVFPLVANKPDLAEKAKSIYKHLKHDLDINTAWDDRGNIGKRYYAQDEIGTPWCITVDYQTLEDDSVTVRDRDTANQERIRITDLDSLFAAKLK